MVTESIFPHIFAGWNLLDKLPCWKLFPLTPIGLNDIDPSGASGIDPDDFQNRIIDPHGILDRLLRLLQMNGHPVLPRRPSATAE